jgi:hypothetical protein
MSEVDYEHWDDLSEAQRRALIEKSEWARFQAHLVRVEKMSGPTALQRAQDDEFRARSIEKFDAENRAAEKRAQRKTENIYMIVLMVLLTIAFFIIGGYVGIRTKIGGELIGLGFLSLFIFSPLFVLLLFIFNRPDDVQTERRK